MSVTTTDLWRMSALELAEGIRSRHMSSQEVIEAHLRRIEAMNPLVNAVTVVLGEQALAVRWHCESELWGATVNPWDRSRTPGARSRRRGRCPCDRHEPIGARQ